LSGLYDGKIIRPLLAGLLEALIPDLERRGFHARLEPPPLHNWFSADLRIARDPFTLRITNTGVDATYVIDCGRPSLMVSLSPYRLYDTYFTEDWKRNSMEEWVEMFRTRDRAPLVARILAALEEPGRVPRVSPKHWLPAKRPSARGTQIGTPPGRKTS